MKIYIDKCKKIGLNAVVIDVILNKELKIDKLRLLKSMNMYIISRFIVFAGNQAPTKNYIQNFNPLDFKYLKKITNFINLISSYNLIDEIQLDYIRYPLGYNLLTLDKKIKIIGQTIDYIVSNINIKISLDLFGVVVTRNYSGIGQHINFAHKVNYISPMIYPGHWGKVYAGIKNPEDKPYELINYIFGRHIKMNKETFIHKLRPYIKGWDCNKEYINKQVSALQKYKIQSYLLWTTNINSCLNSLL